MSLKKKLEKFSKFDENSDVCGELPENDITSDILDSKNEEEELEDSKIELCTMTIY